MIPCSEAVRQLWDYLEDDVAEGQRVDVEQHLAFCRRCCGEVEFAQELRGILASAADVEVALPGDVEQRLVSTLDDLARGQRTPPDDAPDPHPSDRPGGLP